MTLISVIPIPSRTDLILSADVSPVPSTNTRNLSSVIPGSTGSNVLSGFSFDFIRNAAAMDKPAKRMVHSKVTGIKDGTDNNGFLCSPYTSKDEAPLKNNWVADGNNLSDQDSAVDTIGGTAQAIKDGVIDCLASDHDAFPRVIRRPDFSGLSRISGKYGPPVKIVHLDFKHGETAHYFQDILVQCL